MKKPEQFRYKPFPLGYQGRHHQEIAFQPYLEIVTMKNDPPSLQAYKKKHNVAVKDGNNFTSSSWVFGTMYETRARD